MRSWYGDGPWIDFERQTVELHVKLLTICVLGDSRSLFSKTFCFLSLPAKRVRTFIQFVYVSQVPRCWTGRGHVRFVFQVGPGLYLGDVAPQMKSWDCGSLSRGDCPGNGFPGKFPGKLAGGSRVFFPGNWPGVVGFFFPGNWPGVVAIFFPGNWPGVVGFFSREIDRG